MTYRVIDMVNCACAIQQTSDGGYIVVGYFGASGGWNPVYLLVMKINSTGGLEWDRKYEVSSVNIAYSVQQTSDGGYIIAGETGETGFGDRDFLVIKINSTGGVEWAGKFGGPSLDKAYSVLEASDGGYIVVGETASFGEGGDCLIIKVSPDGTMLNCPYWQSLIPTVNTAGIIVESAILQEPTTIWSGSWAPSVNSPSPIETDICPPIVVEEKERNKDTTALQITPNFGKRFNIKYTIQTHGKVSIKIYDLYGKLIKTIFEGELTKGSYCFSWNGEDEQNNDAVSGLYFCVLKAKEPKVTKKITLINKLE